MKTIGLIQNLIKKLNLKRGLTSLTRPTYFSQTCIVYLDEQNLYVEAVYEASGAR